MWVFLKRTSHGTAGSAPGERDTMLDATSTPDSKRANCNATNNNTVTNSAVTTPQHHSLNIITLNISGLRFQTYSETLERYPDTLLGNPQKRQRYFNPQTNEFFFDRHRGSFEAILYFYQSGGRIKRPFYVATDIFIKELRFFEMGPSIMEKFWISEGYIKPEELPLPSNKLQRSVWELLEHPDSSKFARVFAFASVGVIILSIVSFCLETIPGPDDPKPKTEKPMVLTLNFSNFCPVMLNLTDICSDLARKTESNLLQDMNFTDSDNSSNTHLSSTPSDNKIKWEDPFFAIEFICIIWFTVEFVLRFVSCPSKCVFMKNFLNIIDLVAILPFYVNVFMSSSDTTPDKSGMSFAVLRVLRLVRVFRIFKLSRHSVGLQILGKTFKASVQELCLLIFFLCIALVLFSSAMYFAEQSVPGSHFKSIPHAFWYAIVTMTTVGYGDMVPLGPIGKLVGGGCAIIGVLVLALPVPVIVSNFKHFYQQETRLANMKQMEEDEEFDCVEFDSVSD